MFHGGFDTGVIGGCSLHHDIVSPDIANGRGLVGVRMLRRVQGKSTESGLPLMHSAMEEIDMTQEVEDEGIGRVLVDLVRGPGLLDPAMVHDHDPVGHLQGLFLIVGDEDAGHMDLVVKPSQPAAQFGPHLGVQGAERLIEEEHLRLHGQGPGQGDPLPLAAGELGRVAVRQSFELHQLEQVLDLFPDILFGGAYGTRLHVQAEGHIVGHGQVPEERIVLEDEADLAFPDGPAGGVLAVEDDPPRICGLQPGDDPEQGRLARPGGAQERHQLPAGDGQAHVVQGGKAAELFMHMFDDNAHWL